MIFTYCLIGLMVLINVLYVLNATEHFRGDNDE